jgi:hypothetical protein
MDSKLYDTSHAHNTLNVGAMVLMTPNSHQPNIGDLPHPPSMNNLQSTTNQGLAKSSLATIENQSIIEEAERASP